MSLEPKPPAKRKASPQTKLVLTPAARKYIEAVSRRTEIPQRLVVDRLVRDAQLLEREVRKLGYTHVGQVLAVFREMKGAR
jgi:hypothetical protein